MSPSPMTCPFCASNTARLIEADVAAWAVTCEACGAIGPVVEDDAEAAVDAWNMRLTMAKNMGFLRAG